ncbi:hypothetical protein B0H21DRAFT_716622 [Amylocystis lapponica]|nr:hypothetical protein B0H21DRAFT_716622 [Amylocystis lapponica]
MGFTGLARWINAPTTGLELIGQNILRNHQGVYRGKWQMSVKSYRSTLGSAPGFHVPAERSMWTVAMNENVFVLVEDPAAPAALQPAEPMEYPTAPTHYRNTFLTISPPGALEQLLSQLRARWLSVRQSTGSVAAQKGQGAGQQLLIDGHIYSIGSDWIVRCGNVILAGGAVKGVLLEAEYLPLPAFHAPNTDGTSELLSDLLISVLPNVPDAKTVAVTVSDAQWEEVLDWDEESAEEEQDKKNGSLDDDLYVSEEDLVLERKNDWVGVERDRRSAFCVIGALRPEGIL